MALIRCNHAANGPLGLRWEEPGSVVEVGDNKLAAQVLKQPGFSELQPDEVREYFSEVEDVPGLKEHSLDVPPKSGPYATVQRWIDYAVAHGLEFAEDVKRDEIISALEARGVPTVQDKRAFDRYFASKG